MNTLPTSATQDPGVVWSAFRAFAGERGAALVVFDPMIRAERRIAVAHVVHPPATEAALARLMRLPKPTVASLRPLYERADGLRIAASGGGVDRCLVELYPVAAMPAETQAFHDGLADVDEEEDDDGLLDSLVVGGAPGVADRLIVASTGANRGAILRFDHETREITPVARDALALVRRIATDPLAFARLFGSTSGWGETGQAHVTAYAPGRRT